jgi:hypothetical protein
MNPAAPALVNTIELHVGRLLEIRANAGFQTLADLERLQAGLVAIGSRVSSATKFILVSDWRAVGMMSPPIATRVQEALLRNNSRVIRSAILTLPDRSLANLQVLRLVREAENEVRRHFTSATELHRWLSEIATAGEKERLAEFLDLGTQQASSARALVPSVR